MWSQLETECRLTEFNAHRKAVKRELKANGLKRREAAEKAWRVAINEFPPLEAKPEYGAESEATTVEDNPAELTELIAKSSGEVSVDLTSDILWCYTNLINESVPPGKTLSPGA